MREVRIAWVGAALLLLGVVAGQTPATSPSKKGNTKKQAVKSAPKKSAASKSGGTNKSGGQSKQTASSKNKQTTSSKKKSRRPAYRSWRAGQQKPAPERVSEIKRALAARGYLAGDSDGVWDDQSTDALRRFQHDQNLTGDGKLTSLSLIALGLGPKRAPPVPGPVSPKPPPPSKDPPP